MVGSGMVHCLAREGNEVLLADHKTVDRTS